MEAGLYLDNKLILSWDECISSEFIKVKNNTLLSVDNKNCDMLIISDNINILDDNCFIQSTLKKIVISDSVTEIKRKAFYKADNLSELIIGNGVSYIKSSTFSDLGQLKHVSIGKNVQEIGTHAFYNCNKLETVLFANNSKLIQIDEHAFRNCISLKTIELPNKIKTIYNSVFSNCKSLESIKLPNSLSCLEENVFAFTPINEIEISDNVGFVSPLCFIGCEKLKTVKISDKNTTYHNNFNKSNCIIETKDNSLCFIAKNEKIPDNIKIIKENCFLFDVENIYLPHGLEYICTKAFRTDYINELVLPKTLQAIESNAFCTPNPFREGPSINKIKYKGSYEDFIKIKGIETFLHQVSYQIDNVEFAKTLEDLINEGYSVIKANKIIKQQELTK